MKKIALGLFLTLSLLSCDFYQELEYKLSLAPGHYPGEPIILEYDYTPGFNMYLFMEVSSYEGPDNFQSEYFGWFTVPQGQGMKANIRELLERDLGPGDYKLQTREVLSKGGRTTPLDMNEPPKQTLYFRIRDFASDGTTISGSVPFVQSMFNQVKERGYPAGMRYADVILGSYDQNGPLSGLEFYYRLAPFSTIDDFLNPTPIANGILELGPADMSGNFYIRAATPAHPSDGTRLWTNEFEFKMPNYNTNGSLDPSSWTSTPANFTLGEDFTFTIRAGANKVIFPSTYLYLELWDSGTGILLDGPFPYEDYWPVYDETNEEFFLEGRGQIPTSLPANAQIRFNVANPSENPSDPMNFVNVFKFPP